MHIPDSLCGNERFGMFVGSFGESKLLIVTGMAAGAVDHIFIVKLVVSKGEKVINRNTIRSTIIYVCLAAVFIAVMVFDIQGKHQQDTGCRTGGIRRAARTGDEL